MSSAERTPAPSPNDRAEKFVADEQVKYMDLVMYAREAAEMTRTPAWQNTYAATVKDHKDTEIRHAKEIISACETIKAAGSAEDLEKTIADAKKAIAEERERFESWRNLAVIPMVKIVDKCASIKANLMTRAKFEEQDRGLMCAGLTEDVRVLIRTWPVPRFDESTGVMSIG